ncbi:MAG: SelD-related putative sulfur metabolism protein [Sulfolobaceae archaeon]
MNLFEKFRESLERYKEMGLNPLGMATGCAVKVDLIETVYPALEIIKPRLAQLNIEILPREDADIFVTRSKIEHKRLINGGEFDADRGVALIQVSQDTAGDKNKFANFLLRVYTSIKTSKKLVIGKGHSIVTTKKEGEVAVLDLFKLDGEFENSYTLVNNDTIQIVDPLEDPTSRLQTDVAISNSLNDLFAKGAYQDVRVIPVVDAPKAEIKERLLSNFEEFSKEYSFSLVNEVQPNTNTLMIGATVIAKSDHEVPKFYDKVTEGTKLILTRPVGELTPINVYLWVLAIPEMLEVMESSGISMKELEEVKKKAINYMIKPNIGAAKVIYNNLPEFGKEFDPYYHIPITTDVTGPGIFVIKEFAEIAKVNIRINKIPVIDERICEFATENFIIPNSTAGTNGAIVIFAPKKSYDDIMQQLSKNGYEPIEIGEVVGKGNGVVEVPEVITKFIHRGTILNKFKILES